MNRRISLSWILGDRTQVWTGDEKNHHRVFITSSKQRPVKKFHVVVVQEAKKCTKQRATRAKFVV